MEIFTSDRARSRGFGGGGGNFDDRFLRSQNMEIEIMKRGGVKIRNYAWRMANVVVRGDYRDYL